MTKPPSPWRTAVRRSALLAACAVVLLAAGCRVSVDPDELAGVPTAGTDAHADLASLPVKGRAPKTGYDRDRFGPAWRDSDRNGCDTRNDILRRDLVAEVIKPGTYGCVVLSGTLRGPYTGQEIDFRRGGRSEVDIDHVVALGDAWQKGAQQWSDATRTEFANDPLNLLAVDASANRQKGDSDAASWLPRRAFWCEYARRQIAVKARYGLWVTAAERDALARALGTCRSRAISRPGGGDPAGGVAGAGGVVARRG